jgi:hypothetical protein
MGVSAVVRASWSQELHALWDTKRLPPATSRGCKNPPDLRGSGEALFPAALKNSGIPPIKDVTAQSPGQLLTDAQPKHQQRHRNRETASMKKVYTQGSNPRFCDICEEPFGQMMIEGKSKYGWALMCPLCWDDDEPHKKGDFGKVFCKNPDTGQWEKFVRGVKYLI